MCKKYEVGRGKAAAQLILTQPAKSELLPTLLLLPLPLLLKPLLLPTLLLKPLLLLTYQMATLGLTSHLPGLKGLATTSNVLIAVD